MGRFSLAPGQRVFVVRSYRVDGTPNLKPGTLGRLADSHKIAGRYVQGYFVDFDDGSFAVVQPRDIRKSNPRKKKMANPKRFAPMSWQVGRKQAASDLTYSTAKKLLGHLGEVRGKGREWELEVPDEAARKKAHRLCSGLGGYKTGYGAWVLMPRYQSMGDYNYPGSRWHR